MSLQIPTTAALKTNLIAQLESSFGQTIPLLPKSFLRVLATVLAGVLVVLYKYGGYMFLQMFVQYAGTTETEINGHKVIPLVEWGRLTGAGDPTAGVRFEGVITLTVKVASGTIPASTQLYNADNGVTYLTLAAVDLTGAAPVQVSIRAENDQDGTYGRGTVGNLSVADEVTFITPLPNVAATAVIASVTTTGANAEAWEVYRARVLERFRAQPQGGAYTDYRGWSTGVAGIVQAYVYTGDPGYVDVYSEAEATVGNPDGIPTSTQLTAVATAIEQASSGLASRRPVNALVNSYAITRTGFSVAVSGLVVPGDLAAVKVKITEALSAYFLAQEPYINGLSLGARRDRITSSAIAGVVQDVVSAFGGIFATVVYYETVGVNYDIYILAEGEKAKLTEPVVWA